jgi:hypothetical protein
MFSVSSSTRTIFWVAAIAFAGVAAAGVVEFLDYRSSPLISIVHLPEIYARRGSSLSANATARSSKRVTDIRYRVNDHPWHRIARLSTKRFVNGIVTFEMPMEELTPGRNRVRIEADAPLRAKEQQEFVFSYDPAPVVLPLRRAWEGEQLEAQDGYWEAVEVEGEWRVRPKPGYEGYDRILLVTGAFSSSRRIETHMVFRHAVPTRRKEVAFGVLSLWGGHPGSWSSLPRRGWSFAMAQYWSKPGGVGSEFSHYDETSAPLWVNSYRNAPLLENVRYHMVIEVEQERVQGQHRLHRQRTKIWPDGQPEPDEWLVLTDEEGARIPEGEYAVALFALDCQVEFGPVLVLPLVFEGEEVR